jgi:hypothetical protein
MPLTWVEIDCDALCANLAAFRRRVGPRVRLCPVVKANAYGHGAALVGRVTAAAGADFLAVATLDEAEELRRAGLKLPLLVLGYVALADLPAAVAAGFHLTVYNLETLDALERAADKARLRARRAISPTSRTPPATTMRAPRRSASTAPSPVSRASASGLACVTSPAARRPYCSGPPTSTWCAWASPSTATGHPARRRSRRPRGRPPASGCARS